MRCSLSLWTSRSRFGYPGTSSPWAIELALGGSQLLRGQDEGGGGGQKMSVFVHAQGIETVHAEGRGGQKMAKFCPRSC